MNGIEIKGVIATPSNVEYERATLCARRLDDLICQRAERRRHAKFDYCVGEVADQQGTIGLLALRAQRAV